jgi:hypothetical protein
MTVTISEERYQQIKAGVRQAPLLADACRFPRPGIPLKNRYFFSLVFADD